jgi:hypothetical protein
VRFRVDIFLNGTWQVCRLAQLQASMEPGNYGTFPTREMAEKFTKDWPRRECQKEQLRIVEVEK